MKAKIKIPKKVTGYGYVGEWYDGRIGWETPAFVSGKYDRKSPPINSVERNPHMAGSRFFLCEIKITPLKDKRGRPITKIIPKKKSI